MAMREITVKSVLFSLKYSPLSADGLGIKINVEKPGMEKGGESWMA